MATNCSLIHFSGAVGPIIGYTVRGHRYFRSKPSTVRNPRTPSQTSHRQLFALVSSFVSLFRKAYSIGYRNYNTSNYPRANFFNQIYHNAITPTNTIDPSLILLSQGPLPPYIPASTDLFRNHLSLSWLPSSGNPVDLLSVVIYNHSRALSITRADCARRSSRLTLTLTITDEWTNDHLYIYTFFRNPSTNDCSDSTLIAQFNAPDSPQALSAELLNFLHQISHNWPNITLTHSLSPIDNNSHHPPI